MSALLTIREGNQTVSATIPGLESDYVATREDYDSLSHKDAIAWLTENTEYRIPEMKREYDRDSFQTLVRILAAMTLRAAADASADWHNDPKHNDLP